MITTDVKSLNAIAAESTPVSFANATQAWLTHFGVDSAAELDLGTLMTIHELARDGLAPGRDA